MMSLEKGKEMTFAWEGLIPGVRAAVVGEREGTEFELEVGLTFVGVVNGRVRWEGVSTEVEWLGAH